MLIEITQYMRPHGEQKPLEVEIPDKYEDIMNKLEKLNLRITCEHLASGPVAQYITHEEGDFVIELSMPGEETHKKLLEMLDNFDETNFREWLVQIVM